MSEWVCLSVLQYIVQHYNALCNILLDDFAIVFYSKLELNRKESHPESQRPVHMQNFTITRELLIFFNGKTYLLFSSRNAQSPVVSWIIFSRCLSHHRSSGTINRTLTTSWILSRARACQLKLADIDWKTSIV